MFILFLVLSGGSWVVFIMISAELAKSRIKKKKVLLLPFFPLIWLFYFLKYLMTPNILKPGIAAICGDTGGGKTLLAHILSRHFDTKGRKVYANSSFNKIVHYIKIEDYFNNFEILKPLSNGIVIFDEIQQDFNKRMNRKNDYNKVFIPLVEWLQTHRHEGISHVYFLTQSWDNLDVQLQRLTHRVNFVYSKHNADLLTWLKSPKIRPIIRPKKINYFTRRRDELEIKDIDRYIKKKAGRRGKLNYKRIKPSKVTVTLNDLITYNTFAFKRSLAAYKTLETKEKSG